jgi:hypothetical protein
MRLHQLMKSVGLWIAVAGLCLGWASPPTLQAQPTVPNRILELDGNGARVELPLGIFDGLEEATVETWMRWTDLQAEVYQSVFEFGRSDAERGIGLKTVGNTSDLMFTVSAGEGHTHVATVANLIRQGEWCHLAVVSGPGGMRLYFNGGLVATNPVSVSFKDLGKATENYLGAEGQWQLSSRCQMDEFRLWRLARSAEDIQANLSRRLTGREPGLVGLWNFDQIDQDLVKDAGPGQHHGRLVLARKFHT